jgi:hypothetical protein
MEEAATPFPSEETTPPVTKIYFGAIRDGPRTESRTYPPSAGDVQGIMDAPAKRVKRENAMKINRRLREIEFLDGTFRGGQRKYVMWSRKVFVNALTTAAGSW